MLSRDLSAKADFDLDFGVILILLNKWLTFDLGAFFLALQSRWIQNR